MFHPMDVGQSAKPCEILTSTFPLSTSLHHLHFLDYYCVILYYDFPNDILGTTIMEKAVKPLRWIC